MHHVGKEPLPSVTGESPRGNYTAISSERALGVWESKISWALGSPPDRDEPSSDKGGTGTKVDCDGDGVRPSSVVNSFLKCRLSSALIPGQSL